VAWSANGMFINAESLKSEFNSTLLLEGLFHAT